MKVRYFIQLLIVSALWGASFPMLRVAAPEMGPNVAAMLRVAIGTLTLSLIMRAVGQRWPWQDWREMTLLGMASVGMPYLLFCYAATKAPAGYLALLNPTAVVFAVLSSAWFKEDTLTTGKIFGCVLGFVGLSLVVKLGPVEPTFDVLLGAGAAILGTLFYGVTAPFQKRATRRLEPLAIAGPMHLAALLLIAPFGLWDLPQARFTPMGVAMIVMLGAVTSGLAYWAHLRIMRHVTPVAAVTPIFFVPVFGVAWSYLFLNEPVSAGTFIGGAIVLLAAALVTGFNPLRRKSDAALPPT
jgi:drug/metabolite transporter (DMT)-like permease